MIAIFSFAGPAAAQLAGTIAVDSDYRLRGYSMSDGHPAVSVQLSYDHPSGFYASLLGLNEIGHGSRFLGVIGDAGYAKRLGQNVTIDAGVLRSQIRGDPSKALGFKYTAIYGGAYFGPVSGHVYYSPDYRTPGQSAVYSEIEAGFEPRSNWRVSGQVGLLVYLNSTAYWGAGQTRSDWSLNVAHQIGRLNVRAALSTGDPTTDYVGRLHEKPAFTVGGTVSF